MPLVLVWIGQFCRDVNDRQNVIMKVEMLVTNNILFKDSPHPDDHAKQITDSPGFKPFTIVKKG